MMIVTSENITGHHITKTVGQVFGLVVTSRGLGGNMWQLATTYLKRARTHGLRGHIVSNVQTIVAGELVEYTQLLEGARSQAIDRMIESASALGANAVVMMRFDSAPFGRIMNEIVAYGTGVVVEPDD